MSERRHCEPAARFCGTGAARLPLRERPRGHDFRAAVLPTARLPFPAASQPRTAAGSRTLQSRPQWAEAGDLVHIDRLAHALDPCRPARLELEVAVHEFARL